MSNDSVFPTEDQLVKYVSSADGSFCIICEKYPTVCTEHRWDVEKNYFVRKMYCPTCSAEWDDIFERFGVIITEKGNAI